MKKFKLQLVMTWVRYFKWIFRKVKIAWKHQLKFFAIHHCLTSIVPKGKCVHAAIVFCLFILFEIWEFDDWIPNLFTLLSNNLNITTDLKKKHITNSLCKGNLISESICIWFVLLACHKKSYLICVEFSDFQNIM